MRIIYISVFIIAFNLLNVYAKDNINDYSWIKNKQMVSVNLSPGYAGIFPPLVNNLIENINVFANLANIDMSSYQKYIDALLNNIKGSFWYIPTIHYTLLVHPRIGFEIGIGVQSSTYKFKINKGKLSNVLDSFIDSSTDFSSLINSDTIFNATFTYIPITIGLKFLAGKNRQIVNTFRFGIETLLYDIKTESGITGVKTKRSTVDTTLYISYELGFSIELFPTRNWTVKPYLDISLFEIGYYVRSGVPDIYGSFIEGINFLGGGAVDISHELKIPKWGNFPKWVNYVTAIRFSLVPRIGFTLRF